MAKSETDSSQLVNRALLVSNLRSLWTSFQTSDSELRDKLTIHFQNRKCSHGGDVMEVIYPFNTDKDDAIVIFEDAEDQDSAISHKQVFHGQPLTVARLPPVFTSIKAEINPLYFQIMPIDMPDKFLTRFQKMTNVNIDQTNYRRVSCSKPIELEYAEKEIIRLVMSHGDAVSNNTTVIYNDGEFEAAGASDLNYEAAHLQQRSLKEIGDTTSEFLDDEQVNIDGSKRRHTESSKQLDGSEQLIGDNYNARSLVVQSDMSHSSTAVRDKQAAGKADSNANDSSKPLHDSSVVLDKYIYWYLKVIEGPALENVLNCYNVKINVTPGKTEGSLDGVIIPSSSKTKAGNVTKARDEFITLYQKAHVEIMRKQIDCSAVSPRSVEDAAIKTQHHFKDSLITKVNGAPNFRLILRRGDVEEVARQFRSFAGIKSRKTLRTTGADVHDVQNSHETGITSINHLGMGTLQVQSPIEEPHRQQPTTNTLHAAQNPNDTLGLPHGVTFVTNEGMNIVIQQGDITQQRVNAVVSPTDSRLYQTGGVAMAIMRAAGPKLKVNCSKIMKNRNFQSLQMAECIVTSGFNLNCPIIHAVGPILVDQQQFTRDLYTTFLNCLFKAEENKVKTLAIPLIGSGYNRAPKEVCANALAQALLDFSRSSKLKIVADVYLVNIDSDSTIACQQSLHAAFASYNASYRYTSSRPIDATAGTGLLKSAAGTSKSQGWVPHDQTSPLSSNSHPTTDIVKADSDGPPKEMFTGQTKKEQHGSTVSNTSDEVYGNSHGTQDTVARYSRSTGTHHADPLKANTGDKTADDEANECPICLADKMVDVTVLEKCKHRFCKQCIDKALENSYRCPVCRMECGQPRGNQPYGTMEVNSSGVHLSGVHLSGYPNDGVITIRYNIPRGTQTADHPNPGRHFTGATRTAYLPDNREGREVLCLLRKAFDARLVFTVGRSVTSGIDDIVTWNDIHHKTNMSGGPTNYGYPDPDYLKRVKDDLAAKGIV